jgi:hypothetical protein
LIQKLRSAHPSARGRSFTTSRAQLLPPSLLATYPDRTLSCPHLMTGIGKEALTRRGNHAAS